MPASALPLLFATFTLLTTFFYTCKAKYLPIWRSIDSRPLPRWFDQGKVGIFIHWGVYSVPSFGSEWFWYNWRSKNETRLFSFMKGNYPPSFTYQDFAKDFDASLFNPDWWADLIEDSGARYVVLTSKHHDGYTLWPSNYSFSWNAKEIGPKRDLVRDLAEAVRRRTHLKFGLYYSLFEFYHPFYLQDRQNDFRTRHYVDNKMMPELKELVNLYKPEIIWADGDFEATYSYWDSTNFLTWLYNESPVKDTVVTNDRWGQLTNCHHGGFLTCFDRYVPDQVLPRKWENCFTLDKESWGYRREATLKDFLSDLEVISFLAKTVSCGGNVLINIGPRKDGTIDPLMEERLRQLGKWLRINHQAIYDTLPWIYQDDAEGSVWYTAKKIFGGDVVVYAIILEWPRTGHLLLSKIKTTPQSEISMLGMTSHNNFSYSLLNKFLSYSLLNNGGISIDFTKMRNFDLPSKVSWVLKLENLAEEQQKFHSIVTKNEDYSQLFYNLRQYFLAFQINVLFSYNFLRFYLVKILSKLYFKGKAMISAYKIF